MKNEYKQKYKKINITKIAGLLLLILVVLIVFCILVPMAKGILFMFLAAIQLYALLTDVNFKFIGGCFFMIVYWYIFTAIISVAIKIMNKGYELGSFKQDKKQ
jgi:hypothetical protein